MLACFIIVFFKSIMLFCSPLLVLFFFKLTVHLIRVKVALCDIFPSKVLRKIMFLKGIWIVLGIRFDQQKRVWLSKKSSRKVEMFATSLAHVIRSGRELLWSIKRMRTRRRFENLNKVVLWGCSVTVELTRSVSQPTVTFHWMNSCIWQDKTSETSVDVIYLYLLAVSNNTDCLDAEQRSSGEWGKYPPVSSFPFTWFCIFRLSLRTFIRPSVTNISKCK